MVPILLLLICLVFESQGDRNFELLFRSNTQSYSDYPVKADRSLPTWLKGTLFRNGLGQFEMGDRKVQHAFDAFAKICSFTFNGSDHVMFSTRMLETDYYKQSKHQETIAPFLLFDSPVPGFSIIEMAEALMKGIDNTNINVIPVSRDSINQSLTLLAASDFWHQYRFNSKSLETVEKISPHLPVPGVLNKILPLPLPSSAHPVPEYGTNNLISYVSVFNFMPFSSHTVNVIRIKNEVERELIASIPVKQIPYMHSLGLSKRYAIILAHPLTVNVNTILSTANPSKSLEWDPKKHTQIYVVHILKGKVYKIKTKIQPKFNMHHINSYEISKRRILVDYVAYPNVDFMKSLDLEKLRDKSLRNSLDPQAELIRYEIDLKSLTASMEIMKPTRNKEFVNTMDLPSINENFRHRKHCFAYGVAFKCDNRTTSRTALVKKNVCHNGRDKAWEGETQYVSEPIFVPRPGSIREDDGVLLSVILNGDKAASYIAVINARNMKIKSRIQLPTIVPFSLHGQFLNDDIKLS